MEKINKLDLDVLGDVYHYVKLMIGGPNNLMMSDEKIADCAVIVTEEMKSLEVLDAKYYKVLFREGLEALCLYNEGKLKFYSFANDGNSRPDGDGFGNMTTADADWHAWQSKIYEHKRTIVFIETAEQKKLYLKASALSKLTAEEKLALNL